MEIFRELSGKFGVISKENVKRASNYLVLTGNDDVDYSSIITLEMLRQNVKSGISNDITKYCLSENYKVRLQTQFNGRSLQNFLELRTNKDALWEIRDLAYAIYEALPSEHKYLYTDYLYKENNNEN